MNDASRARAAPGAGAAASERATERAAEEEEFRFDCPDPPRALLLPLVLMLSVAPAEPRSPPSATPSPPLVWPDITSSSRESGEGQPRARLRALSAVLSFFFFFEDDQQTSSLADVVDVLVAKE